MSDSDGSAVNDRDSDSNFEVSSGSSDEDFSSSESQDEDFSVSDSEPSAPRNRNSRQKSTGGNNFSEESSSSLDALALIDGMTESQPPGSVRKSRSRRRVVTRKKKKRRILSPSSEPGSEIISYECKTCSKLKLNLFLCLAGEKPVVSSTEAFVQTGPETFRYLDTYEMKKIEDGYECCSCGFKHHLRVKLLRHIRMEHARKL